MDGLWPSHNITYMIQTMINSCHVLSFFFDLSKTTDECSRLFGASGGVFALRTPGALLLY